MQNYQFGFKNCASFNPTTNSPNKKISIQAVSLNTYFETFSIDAQKESMVILVFDEFGFSSIVQY